MNKMLLATVAVITLANTALAQDFATGQEVSDYISGNTYKGVSDWGVTADYHEPDGTLRSASYTAEWKIEGDEVCVRYDDTGFQCWAATIDGRASVWYKDGVAVAAGMIFQGNPDGL